MTEQRKFSKPEKALGWVLCGCAGALALAGTAWLVAKIIGGIS